MGKGCILTGEIAWTHHSASRPRGSQGRDDWVRSWGRSFGRWTWAQSCDPNSAMGSKSEVKDVEAILFHFTYLLCNMLLILGKSQTMVLISHQQANNMVLWQLFRVFPSGNHFSFLCDCVWIRVIRLFVKVGCSKLMVSCFCTLTDSLLNFYYLTSWHCIPTYTSASCTILWFMHLANPLLILPNIDHVSLRGEIIPNFSHLASGTGRNELMCMNERTHIHPA